MRFGLFFCGAWAVVGTLFRFGGGNHRNDMPLLLFAVVAYAPLLIYKHFAGKREKEEASAREEFLRIAGAPKYSHFEKDTAIALDPIAGTVTMRQSAAMKRYRFEEVREWTNAHAMAGAVAPIVGGVTNSLLTGIAAAGAQARADAETGFFVRVRDIDAPEWRIAMASKAERARWAEIFEQELNEARRVAPAA